MVAVAVVSLALWMGGGTAWADGPTTDCPTWSVSAANTAISAAPTATATATASATPTAVQPAQISGTYTRSGMQLVVTSPPGDYPTFPISAGGSGWELPTTTPVTGVVAGATVSLLLAGADGALDTADDQVRRPSRTQRAPTRSASPASGPPA